jgi:hypothetical protein
MNTRQERCVQGGDDPVGAGEAGVEHDGPMESERDAAMGPPAPVPDAMIDPPAPAQDAGRDAQVEPPWKPDAGHDGDVDAGPDAGRDAATPADAGEPDAGIVCEPDDIADWKQFHTTPGLVHAILSCNAKPLCAGQPCEVIACIRSAAQVQACDLCVADEASCMFMACGAACGARGNDEKCRACACANGCTEAFGSCAGAAMDEVCADCDGSSCSNMSVLPPELIMVILHPVLMGR